MPKEISGKPITVRLSPEFRAALAYFRQHDPRHLTVAEQVRRGLLFYWMQQPIPTSVDTLNLVLPGFEPGDEEFGVVAEDNDGDA